jgi:L-ascorbate metabolism protein UlaG (beta-lactamase superfamily)
MIITYCGAEFFKVSFGNTTLAFNPISKDSKLKQTRFGADIALITTEHPDMNGATQVSLGDKEPFIIRGPGEYEKNDVLIKGYPTVTRYGGVERINTAYLVTLEKMLILFLGAIATRDLPTELKEALDKIDLLFVPIGGDGVLEPDDAYAFAASIEPKIIVPMHYTAPSTGSNTLGSAHALDLFLKEEGGLEHTPVDKLTIKPKDLEGKENEVVVFAY